MIHKIKTFKKYINIPKRAVNLKEMVDVSNLFSNDSIIASIPKTRSDLKLLSVPVNDRSKKHINVPINFSDYKDDTIVVIQHKKWGEIYYLIIREYDWILFDSKGREISKLPYNIDMKDLYHKIKKEIR
jgi:hypothetical protein